MLSMPAGTDPAEVKKAVSAFAAAEFSDHQYAFVLIVGMTIRAVHHTAPAYAFVREDRLCVGRPTQSTQAGSAAQV